MDRVVPTGKALDAAKRIGQGNFCSHPGHAADRAAAWAAFDGGEAARLIEEERGAQAAKAQEAAIGAARFKAGEGRGSAVPGKAPKSEG